MTAAWSGEWSGADDRKEALARLVSVALLEDIGDGDRTTLWTVPEGRPGRATVVAKEPLVLSGTDPFRAVFARLDPEVRIELRHRDGDAVPEGAEVLHLEGSARSILVGERTALNFMGRLSGIATLTRRFVKEVEGTGASVIDTRKTTPGWRLLEKEAVRHGGGENHRHGLYDMVLIKDNHIVAAGGIGAAMARVAERNHLALPVEVEVTTPEQLEEALAGAPTRILLDNLSVDAMARAVARVRTLPAPRPLLEASGNISLSTIRRVAESGVDLISVGALTHSAPVADLSMRMEW